MKKRILLASLVFFVFTALSLIPIAIVLAILDLYLSGQSIVNLGTTEVFMGLDWLNFIFILSALFTGLVAAGIYWRFSKPSED
jgi:hypothetical protein